MTDIMQKISKRSKWIKRLLYFFFAFTLLYEGGQVWLFVTRLRTFAADTAGFTKGDTVYNEAMRVVINAAHGGIAMLCIGAIAFIAIRSFAAIEKNGSPFIPVVTRNMKLISWLLLSMYSLLWYAATLVRMMLIGDTNLTLIGDYNSFGLIISAVCFCFALFFDYGCQLQQENDETL